MRRRLRFGAVWVCLLLLAGAPADVRAQASAEVDGTSRLSGRVLGADGKTPLRGARVIAYHLSSERIFTSEPTAGKAEYRLEGLPYGYFDLAVETAEGVFVGNQVVNLPPNGKVTVHFTLRPAGGPLEAREFPGSEQATAGTVQLKERLGGRDFWRSPRGIAVMAGAGGAVLLAVASGGGSGSTAIAVPSPSAP